MAKSRNFPTTVSKHST